MDENDYVRIITDFSFLLELIPGIGIVEKARRTGRRRSLDRDRSRLEA